MSLLRELHTASATIQRAYAEALNLGERELAAEIERAAGVVASAIGLLINGGKKAS